MKKPSQVRKESSPKAPAVPDPKAIEALAYQYWLARGCPIGSPEIDWRQAEEDLKSAMLSTAA